MKSSPLNGSPDWLLDVIQRDSANPYFRHTCHKTDPAADGFVGGKVRECVGHVAMMLNKIDKTPGKGGVYLSLREMVRDYAAHWDRLDLL